MLFAADPPATGNSFLAYLPFVLIAVALYFVLIRPQNKRRREAQSMQSSIGPGDAVQTVGGLYGTVTDVDDESVTLEAAPGVELRFARGAIAKVITSVQSQAEADDSDNDDDDDEVEDGNADARRAVDER